MSLEQSPTAFHNRKRIFVVHGRNMRTRTAMFNFLKAIGLEPLDWDSLRKMTGQGTPFTLDVVRRGMSAAWATVVIWNPEERVHLLPPFRGVSTRKGDQQYANQPRPNVILEAGMALALMPSRVIFVHFGEVRTISDLEGLHVLKSTEDLVDRATLAGTLSSIGCDVQLKGDAWRSAGNFRNARSVPKRSVPPLLRDECKSAPCYGSWFAYEHDFHSAGSAVQDALATKGWAWLCAADLGHAVYGPYDSLPKGNYEAWFRVHVREGNACLEVFNQEKNIHEANIPMSGGYELHRLPFVLRDVTLIEFRVAHTPGTVTATDFTAVTGTP